ncbi:MAG: hypothetical protein GF331_12980 [Chitinivibrionales bacterium]|nr:hypothetical protein [Chitinivibrionales bacterium]
MATRVLIPPATSPVFPNHCAACLREPAGYHEITLELTDPVTVDRGGIKIIAGHQTTQRTCAVPYCSSHLKKSLRHPRLVRAARRNCVLGALLVAGGIAAGTGQLLYMYSYLMEQQPAVFAAIVAGAFVTSLLIALLLLSRFMYRLCGLLLPPKRNREDAAWSALGMRFVTMPTADGDSQVAMTIANTRYAELFRRANRC